MGVLVDGVGLVRVEVAVGLAACMAVGVGVEDAAAPPHEQADREHHDDEPYGDLRGLSYPLGQVLAKQHERQPDEDEGGAVPEAPEQAKGRGFPYSLPLLRGYEGGDGGQVIRVRGVSQAQKEAHHQDHPQGRRSLQEAFEPAVYRGHARCSFLASRTAVR